MQWVGILLSGGKAGWLMTLPTIFERNNRHIKVLGLSSDDDWTQFDTTLRFYWTIHQTHHPLPLELHEVGGNEAIRWFHHKNKCQHCFISCCRRDAFSNITVSGFHFITGWGKAVKEEWFGWGCRSSMTTYGQNDNVIITRFVGLFDKFFFQLFTF